LVCDVDHELIRCGAKPRVKYREHVDEQKIELRQLRRTGRSLEEVSSALKRVRSTVRSTRTLSASASRVIDGRVQP
jgi:hypothetical protein